VADDHGICIVTGRKWLSRTRPIHYYFFAWSDVIGYRLTSGHAAAAANDTELTIYTRRGQHSWDLPLSEPKVRTLLGRWLARIPSVA
jgi:hypothetical protein